jgi:glycosyltransferase involved in cell wall biosynthesis
VRIAVHSSARSIEDGGGSTYIVSLASALSRCGEIDLFFREPVAQEQIDRLLPAAARGVRLRTEPLAWTTRLLGEARRALADLPYDKVVVQSTMIPRIAINRNAWLLCEFPFQQRVPWDDRIRLRSYGCLIANSAFTAKWIEQYWGRQADVLYPAVAPIAPGLKRPCILGVGRFAGGGRSKQQLELVTMFRRLCERGLAGWELHLAGYPQDAAYVEQVRRSADDLPVQLHVTADRAELELLYATSSIFWHATGMGADPMREPGRMEHFGIVTAEAMSAGCVPVVFNGGGQPEIVTHESTGVLWDSYDDCVEVTWRLAHDAQWRDSLACAGTARARIFSPAVFEARVRELFRADRDA